MTLPEATFGCFPQTASRGLSCAWVWCKLHQSRSVGPFAGHSTRINWWNLENTNISKSASWRSLEQVLAVFPRLQVNSSSDLGFGMNRLKVVLLVLLQAIPSESTVGSWKILALAKVPRFAPWSIFWLFCRDCKSKALLRFGLVQIVSKSVCWYFRRPFHPNQLMEPGKYQH